MSGVRDGENRRQRRSHQVLEDGTDLAMQLVTAQLAGDRRWVAEQLAGLSPVELIATCVAMAQVTVATHVAWCRTYRLPEDEIPAAWAQVAATIERARARGSL